MPGVRELILADYAALLRTSPYITTHENNYRIKLIPFWLSLFTTRPHQDPRENP